MTKFAFALEESQPVERNPCKPVLKKKKIRGVKNAFFLFLALAQYIDYARVWRLAESFSVKNRIDCSLEAFKGTSAGKQIPAN